MPHRLQPNISILDKSFQENAVSSYVLAMQLNATRISFTLFNPGSNKYIGLTNEYLHTGEGTTLADEVETAIGKHPLLNHDYRRVILSFGGFQNTLVPHALFDGIRAEKYLDYNHTLADGDAVLYDSLENTAAANIYSIPMGLRDKLQKKWPDITIRHLSSVLIESLGINFRHVAGDNMVFVNVREEYFDMVHFRNSRLHFYNLFRYRTREDFIYFLLAAMDQLELNPESVALVFMGSVTKDSRLYEIARRYIRNCRFIETNSTFGYAHVLDDLQMHEYYSLFSILQCVS